MGFAGLLTDDDELTLELDEELSEAVGCPCSTATIASNLEMMADTNPFSLV